MTEIINKGLEGVYFTQSRICKVDGIKGKLYYRGYTIEELVKKSTYEEICYLLLYKRLPTLKELKNFKMKLENKRSLNSDIIYLIQNAGNNDVMHVLRTTISAIAEKVNAPDDQSHSLENCINIIAKISSIVATIGRIRAGLNYIEPKKNMGYAESFLYMLNGKIPNKKDIKIMDKMLILHAEHSSNASTFSAIVTASTLSDIYSAITSAIGTLKGPLHGEADENALRMLYNIAKPQNTEKYINNALKDKEKIMGFGHRIYKTYDPRAKIIRSTLVEMEKSSNVEIRNITKIALRAEKMMVEKLGKTHNIWPNVDFFAGPVYRYIGIPLELFTPLFAVGRSPGWCAHVMEYWEDNKLIRPLEKYTGAIERKYIKIQDR